MMPEIAPLVELFDRNRYHSNISVGENIVFGTPTDAAFVPENLIANAEVRQLIADVGLLDELELAGIGVARLMVELFADEQPDSELFAEYSIISPEDLVEFRTILRKIDDKGRQALAPRERQMFLALALKVVVGRHRLGIPDAAMQERVVAARLEFQRRFAERNVVEFYDPQRFSPELSIQDNILFGRPVYEQARAQARRHRARARGRARGRHGSRADPQGARVPRGRERRATVLLAEAADRDRPRADEGSRRAGHGRADVRTRPGAGAHAGDRRAGADEAVARCCGRSATRSSRSCSIACSCSITGGSSTTLRSRIFPPTRRR